MSMLIHETFMQIEMCSLVDKRSYIYTVRCISLNLFLYFYSIDTYLLPFKYVFSVQMN